MWFDRITQKAIASLPLDIQSSRYLSMKTVTMNTRVKVHMDQFLVDDGTGTCQFDQSDRSGFECPNLSESQLVEKNIVDNVLLEYAEQVATGGRPSILIPETILDRLDLQPFDMLIEDVLAKGHLQEIARLPKMDLIYEERLLPVGRVKKVPGTASRYLAAHSECWQKRTFTGVIPRSLLALESKDEFNIYENRVYVRLLDHLDRYLESRCREVARIESALAEAADFEASNDLYFGLVHSVCQIWGEGFRSGTKLADEAEEGIGTLAVLRKMLKNIRGLRCTRLYRAIPRADDVSYSLRLTNTLKHDQHYRHVARLWSSWVEYSSDGKVDPAIQFERNQRYAEAFVAYVTQLVVRAFEDLGGAVCELGFSLPGDRVVEFDVEKHIISLRYYGKTLSIVPIYDWVDTNFCLDTSIPGHQTVVVVPSTANFCLERNIQTASPLYFYCLEAMTTRLSSWVTRCSLTVLSEEIPKVPTAVTSTLKAKYTDYIVVNGTVGKVKKPLGQVLSSVHAEFSAHNKDTSVARFLESLDGISRKMDALLVCPICGNQESSTSYHYRSDGAFEISNAKCDHFWRIDKDVESNRMFVAGPIESLSDSTPIGDFKQFGHYSYQIPLNDNDTARDRNHAAS